jgi:hypothetical protein
VPNILLPMPGGGSGGGGDFHIKVQYQPGERDHSEQHPRQSWLNIWKGEFGL